MEYYMCCIIIGSQKLVLNLICNATIHLCILYYIPMIVISFIIEAQFFHIHVAKLKKKIKTNILYIVWKELPLLLSEY